MGLVVVVAVALRLLFVCDGGGGGAPVKSISVKLVNIPPEVKLCCGPEVVSVKRVSGLGVVLEVADLEMLDFGDLLC